MSASSASRVELAEVGMLPQILSTLISSSRLLIQPGLFRRTSITLPRTFVDVATKWDEIMGHYILANQKMDDCFKK